MSTHFSIAITELAKHYSKKIIRFEFDDDIPFRFPEDRNESFYWHLAILKTVLCWRLRLGMAVDQRNERNISQRGMNDDVINYAGFSLPIIFRFIITFLLAFLAYHPDLNLVFRDTNIYIVSMVVRIEMQLNSVQRKQIIIPRKTLNGMMEWRYFV